MKVIIQFQCEVCLKKYDSEEKAKECESRGVFDDSIYPRGLMFPFKHQNMAAIFAIPEKIPPYVYDNHLGNSASWACRNTPVGDTLGKEQCGGHYYYSDKEGFSRWLAHYHMTKKDMETKEFTRMVEYLKSIGVQPSYYDKKGNLCTIM
jgi:hypothetical protein